MRQKIEVPAKDFLTKQTIPGNMITRYRFQAYDLTSFDPNNPPAIWERGMIEADQVPDWLEKGISELHPIHRKRIITYILPTDDGETIPILFS